MWVTLFDRALRRYIRVGALEVEYSDGRVERYGDAAAEPVRVRLSDPGLARGLLLQPELTLGEAYMEGRLEIGNDDLEGLFRIVLTNQRAGNQPPEMRLWESYARPVQKFLAHNRIAASRANVAHHYDLNSRLYNLFLDRDRQYSCAYFAGGENDLDAAQEAKKRHIARKLLLRPGARVLDIGCGWGGMALTLARDFGAHVTGITLSTEQHRIARARAEEAGLSDRIDIRLTDYREITGRFDRIVSVGMFEHVGLPQFDTYFRTVRRLLAEEGVALIHTIGVAGPPRATGAWIRKYIFPGGYLPALSEIVAATERAKLPLTDIEVLRDHYAMTLAHWADRFEARNADAEALYDARFVRMWRYYLRAAEASFRYGSNVVYQLQISRSKAAVPLTRDYLYDRITPASG